jgi:hypothetical protein
MKNIVFIITISAAVLFQTDLFAKITVESIKGEAAYKKGRQWVPLSKGMELAEGTKVSTGVKSWALLNIDGDSLRVRELTMMKIFRSRKTAERKDTHIGLKHGSLRARIQRLGTLKTSFKISTPVATSSVRGTEQIVTYGSKSGMTIQVLEGTVEGQNPNGSTKLVSGKSVYKQKPDDSKPENLLSDEKDKSVVQISDPNITDDEKDSQEYSGYDTIENTENIQDLIPDIPPTTTVNVTVEW